MSLVNSLDYRQLEPQHFERLIELANEVHGDNYLDLASLQNIYQAGLCKGINASWVALTKSHQLIGFRLTYAPSNWKPDIWCTADDWGVPQRRVCYFKCNTVAEASRGRGVGSALLRRSIDSVIQQGATAGVAHIWMASPHNSAFRYFSANGGQVVNYHPRKWHKSSIEDGYVCPVCGALCQCTAAEMIIHF